MLNPNTIAELDNALNTYLRPRFDALVAALRADDVDAMRGALATMRRGLDLGLGLCGPRQDAAMNLIIDRVHGKVLR